MARWENHSGTAISVPVVGRDVDAGEIVTVPDDVLLPENYFRRVEVEGSVQETFVVQEGE